MDEQGKSNEIPSTIQDESKPELDEPNEPDEPVFPSPKRHAIASSTSKSVDTITDPTRIFVEKSPMVSFGGLELRNAAILCIYSLLVLNEGAIRLNWVLPSVDLLLGGRPPKFLLFLAAMFEVFLGVVGLLVGLVALISNRYSAIATELVILIQFVLTLFVFSMFVFVVPIFRAIDLEETVLDGISLRQSRFLIALGLFTSAHLCLALQGGQFVFLVRLRCLATGRDWLHQKYGSVVRAVFWNLNMGFAGLWTVITGALLMSNIGTGRLAEAFLFPPHVGVLPVLTLVTGLAQIAWGVIGVLKAGMGQSVGRVYFIGSVVVYLNTLLNYVLLQFGLMKTANGGDVAIHAGLTFALTFIGPFFVFETYRERIGLKDDEEIVQV